MNLPKWLSSKTEHVTVTVNSIEVDEAVAKIESATSKLEVRHMALMHTIAEAKRTKNELELTIHQARKTGRGKW